MKTYELKTVSIDELQELIGKSIKEGRITAIEERGNYLDFFVDDDRPTTPVSFRRSPSASLQLDGDYAAWIAKI